MPICNLAWQASPHTPPETTPDEVMSAATMLMKGVTNHADEGDDKQIGRADGEDDKQIDHDVSAPAAAAAAESKQTDHVDPGDTAKQDDGNGDGEEPPVDAELGEVPTSTPDPSELEKGKKRKKSDEEIRKHRESSRRWHAKWVKKGVPKTEEEAEGGSPQAAAAQEGSQAAAPHEAPQAPAAPLPDTDLPVDPEMMQKAGLL